MGAGWWMKFGSRSETASACALLNLRTAELRAESDNLAQASRTPDNIEKVLQLMRQAESLEADYVAWERGVPEEWKYSHATWIDSLPEDDNGKSGIFPGRIDSYSELWIASVWNLYRASSLLICSVILRNTAWLCAPSDYRLTSEFSRVQRRARDLIEDIIASIPMFLGCKLDTVNFDFLDRGGFVCGEGGVAGRSLCGLFIVWPILSTLHSDFATDAQRKYLQERCRFIGEDLGIGTAAVFSKV
jgi:hypothetical protein